MSRAAFSASCAALISVCCSGGVENTAVLVEVGAEPSRYLVITDSIGIDHGDTNYVMGGIEGLEYGPDGNILVLDCGRSCVRIYSPEGEYLRQVAGCGSGPGELQNPTFIAVSQDGIVYISGSGGDILGVHAYEYSTGEWLGSEQTFVPPSCLEGCEGSSYVRKTIGFQMREDEPYLLITIAKHDYLMDEPLVVLYEESLRLDLTDEAGLLELDWYGYDIAADEHGQVYIAPRSTGEALVITYDSTGSEIRRIRLDLKATARTEDEMQMERNILRAKAIASGENPQGLEPDPFKPLIRGLDIDDQGNLWVLHGGPSVPTFSVFSAGGEFLHTASVSACPPDGSTWRFHMDEHGILAYAEDPASGFQKVYILEVTEQDLYVH
jgi:hypothetical protein